MKNRKMLQLKSKGVIELTDSEITRINGGSWLSYWLGAACATLNNIQNAYCKTDEGAAVQQALRDFG